MANDRRRELKIDEHWFQSGRIVIKFAGIDSINDVESLRNAEICVAESDVVELEADSFFDWQLVSCRVETIEGAAIGSVREVMRTGGTEILVVDGIDKEYLVPFAGSICVEVAIDKKLIRIDPPDGLLEF